VETQVNIQVDTEYESLSKENCDEPDDVNMIFGPYLIINTQVLKQMNNLASLFKRKYVIEKTKTNGKVRERERTKRRRESEIET
jgi:hypothetical protein